MVMYDRQGVNASVCTTKRGGWSREDQDPRRRETQVLTNKDLLRVYLLRGLTNSRVARRAERRRRPSVAFSSSTTGKKIKGGAFAFHASTSDQALVVLHVQLGVVEFEAGGSDSLVVKKGSKIFSSNVSGMPEPLSLKAISAPAAGLLGLRPKPPSLWDRLAPPCGGRS